MEGLKNRMRVRGKICIIKRKFPIAFWKTLFPEAVDTIVLWCWGGQWPTHGRCCSGGPGRETVRLDESFGSVDILWSVWQSVRGDSCIVMVPWVEETYFHGFKHLYSFENSGIGRWNFPRKQLLDSVFPAFIHFPRRKWYALLKTCPRPGTRK